MTSFAKNPNWEKRSDEDNIKIYSRLMVVEILKGLS